MTALVLATLPTTAARLAYIVLFFPVVVAARWIEIRFAWKR